MAQIIEDPEEYIYDAICDNRFKYNPDTKMYHYSNPQFPNKNYKKTYDPISRYLKCEKCNYNKQILLTDTYMVCLPSCTHYNTKGYSYILRGDIVHFGDDNYRNNNKLIFDGKKLINLYTEIDDYGSVPPEFKVGEEFDPVHWSRNNAITHNSIIFLEDNLFDTFKLWKYDNQIIGSIMILGIKEMVVIYDENETKLTIPEIKNLLITHKPPVHYENNRIKIYIN
jgi:hypothetical protein